MSTQYQDVERQAKALPHEEKAALVCKLIEDLDTAADAEVEQVWLEEAESRYAAYLRGELEALPGEEVMARARNRQN